MTDREKLLAEILAKLASLSDAERKAVTDKAKEIIANR